MNEFKLGEDVLESEENTKLQRRDLKLYYQRLCPVCDDLLRPEEIELSRCLVKDEDIVPGNWVSELEVFERFFRQTFGEDMRTVQRSWAKKLLLGLSFAISAPTGTGKTVFGLIACLYKRRALVIFPTKVLVKQAEEKLKTWLGKVSELEGIRVLAYHADIRREEREELLKLIENDEFDILLVTSQFLVRYFNIIKDKRFELIFVDDLDSIARNSRNIDKLLALMGFSSRDVWLAKNVRDISKYQLSTPMGQLIISTATFRSGQNTRLFSRLLGFAPGSSAGLLRKIWDIVWTGKDIELLRSCLKRLGPGGLIYANSIEEAEKLAEYLEMDFKVGLATAKSSKSIDLFAEGKLDYLIGASSPYSVLVRGIDLPLRIRYVIFWGLPKRSLKLTELESYASNKYVIGFLARLLTGKRTASIEELKLKIEHIEDGLYSTFVLKDRTLYTIDLTTYIQASGRASRFMPWGITQGLSLVFDDVLFIEAFRKLGYIYGFETLKLDEADLEVMSDELDRSRIPRDGTVLDLKTYLIIVESPTKARQIASFFGTPSAVKIDNLYGYEAVTPWGIVAVVPSFGHIVDLTTDEDSCRDTEKYDGGRNVYGVIVDENFYKPVFAPIIRCENCKAQFTRYVERCPYCGSENLRDSRYHVDSLRKAAYVFENVILATDPDNEGEKIAYDLMNLLKSYSTNIYRIRFHEITRRAMQEAMNQLTSVSAELVKAQLARRIEDRWLGFKLTEKLQEHQQELLIDDKRFKTFSIDPESRLLSAGRVQTPVLGWVVDRFEEYNRDRISYVTLQKLGLKLDGLRYSGPVVVEIEVKDSQIRELWVKPFNTPDLLMEASRILKLPASETMRLAQTLFEHGLITYHRTDSYHISDKGFSIAREILGERFVYKNYPEEGAHETIRITKPVNFEDVRMHYKLEWMALRLYDLIYRRFLSACSGPIKVRDESYIIRLLKPETSDLLGEFELSFTVDASGFALEYYPWAVWVRTGLKPGRYSDKAKAGSRPKVTLYTQADLVRLMREKKIGRPSTYSTIISKLFKRGYVFENKVGKIIPTKTGIRVLKFLRENYGKFVSVERTRILQEKIDAIEAGKLDLADVLDELLEEIEKM